MPKQTTFRYTRIPDMAQWGGLKWDNRTETTSGSLADAKRKAEEDPNVSFFFHAKAAMSLSHGANRKSIKANDNVFFKGDYHLGTAPGYADTYLVAEVYDTSDEGNRNEILEQLRQLP